MLPLNRIAACIGVASALLIPSGAFAPSGSLPHLARDTQRHGGPSQSKLHVVPPDHLVEPTKDLLLDSSAIAYMSTLLADAAANVPQPPTGPWGAYINFFKGCLNGVHSLIDQPLRNVGFDQTWGVSIALFTCCK